MPTYTTNYNLAKPLVNNAVDQDQWGTEINGDMDTIDSTMKSISTVANAATDARGTDTASAATVDLTQATVLGNFVLITGTTTITAITLPAGKQCAVEFSGALTLTNNTAIVCLGGANITTSAGDKALFVGYSSGVVHMLAYQKADGTPLKINYSNLPSGTVVHSNLQSYGSQTQFSSNIPADNTVPQISEGTEILAVPFAASSTSNLVRVRVSGFGGASSSSNTMTAALFTDSNVNALKAVGFNSPSGSTVNSFAFEYTYTPGTVSSITYRLRVGSDSSTMRINGSNSGALYSSAASISMVVEEVVP